MKIETFRAKGFKGFKRGLGMDEISVDFSGKSGLIALAGDNGTGKSTMMELLQPYPQLVSRDGALFHHVDTRDAERELTFTYAGHRYRTLLKIDGQGEKQEGYVWKDGEPQVNGKISEYSKYIRNLLGSPELFFSSVFCAQNSKKLSDLTTGQLKGLFSEFLRLDRLQGWDETAKAVGNVVAGKVAGVNTRIEILSDHISFRAGIVDGQTSAMSKLEFLQDDKTLLQHDLEEKRKAVDTLKATIAANALAVERRADIQKQIDRLNADLARERTTAEGEIKTLAEKYHAVKGSLSSVDAILKDRAQIETAAERLKAWEAKGAEIQGKRDALTAELPGQQERAHGAETALTAAKQALRDLDNNPEIAELDKAIDAAVRDAREIGQEIERLNHDHETIRILGAIDNALEKTTALDLKDPACQSTTCSFIVGALEAQKTLPELNAQLEARKKLVAEGIAILQAKVKALEEDRHGKQERRTALLEQQATAKREAADRIRAIEPDLRNAQQIVLNTTQLLNTYREDLTTIARETESLKALTARLPEIAVAVERKNGLEKQLAEVMTQGTARKTAWEEKQKAIDGEVMQLIADQGALEVDDTAERSLSQTQKEITEIETVRIPAVEREIQAAREKIATLQAELTRIEQAEKELEGVRAERERLVREQAEWSYIQVACGKKGLQALEIDGAAPLITARANELLALAFGPLFTVRFRTQDDEGREVLDIMVIAEDGTEVLLDNLSGGQRVWILKALRLSMTLLSAEKSGRSFETFFSDEEDGALDVDNARNFIALYQAFMEKGGFGNGIYISHKPECRAFADHVLKFEAGKNPAWG